MRRKLQVDNLGHVYAPHEHLGDTTADLTTSIPFTFYNSTHSREMITSLT